jgi:hypothetical protein
MRKTVLILAVLIVIVLIAADFKKENTTASLQVNPQKKPCYGYTIIEFGKGIDCNGDTVKLVKVKGGQELLRDVTVSEPAPAGD